MKALILAAGYGTRMLQSAAGAKYKKLINALPKPLLPLRGKPVVFQIYKKLRQGRDIDEIFLITNNKYFHLYEKWQNESGLRIKLLKNGSTANENRLGAVGDMALAIKKCGIKEDFFIIAGDTLLEFDINDYIGFYQKKYPIIALHQADSLEQIKQRNEVKIDMSNKITGFAEKPKNPKSLLYAPPCYIFPKNILPLLEIYLSAGNNPDAPGMFIEWLHKVTLVYGYDKIKRRFDIGNLESYKEALDNFNI